MALRQLSLERLCPRTDVKMWTTAGVPHARSTATTAQAGHTCHKRRHLGCTRAATSFTSVFSLYTRRRATGTLDPRTQPRHSTSMSMHMSTATSSRNTSTGSSQGEAGRMSANSAAIKTLLALNTDARWIERFSQLIFREEQHQQQRERLHLDPLTSTLVLCTALAASNRPNTISCAVIAYVQGKVLGHEVGDVASEAQVLSKLESNNNSDINDKDKDEDKDRVSRQDIVEDLAKIRESVFKAFAVIGIPKAINGLTCLKTISHQYPSLFGEMESTFRPPEFYPQSTLARNADLDARNNGDDHNINNNNNNTNNNTPAHVCSHQLLTPEELRLRGIQLFDTIYGKHTLKLKRILDGLHPSFLDCIIDESYGRVLGEMCVLGVLATEFVMYAALKAQGGLVERQATSHMIGAKKFGASEAHIAQIDSIVAAIQEIPVPLT